MGNLKATTTITIAAVACLAACGDPPAQPVIVPQLAIVTGDAQTDTVGRTLPVQLGAQLTDKASGAPLPGRVVNWVVIEGNGSVFAPVTQTGSDGVARQSWTLGQTAGGQRLVARWLDPETGEAVTLDTARATAVPKAAVTAFARPQRDSVLGGDTLQVEYGYSDAFGNSTWSGCAAPDSVGWTWDADGIAYDSIVGFIYTTNPNTTWYMFAPIVQNGRRFLRVVMPNAAHDVHFQAYNTCLGTVATASTVYLRPVP